MKIAILGHGTVGSGVAEILIENANEVSAAAEKNIELGAILDIRNFEGISYSDKFVSDFDEILNDPEIGIVAEAMGGTEPAFSYIKAALEKGKNAVTSNKELVAEKGAELLSIARAHNVNFLFEASVGGGIPLIRPLYSAMNAAGITEIAGILNGTTNYILTKMFRFGSDMKKRLPMLKGWDMRKEILPRTCLDLTPAAKLRYFLRWYGKRLCVRKKYPPRALTK